MLGWELPPHNSGGLGVACYHMSKALSHVGATIDFVLPYQAEHDISFMTISAATRLEPSVIGANMGAYDSFCRCDDSTSCDHACMDDLTALRGRYGEYVKRLVVEKPPQVIHAHDWLTMEAGIAAKEIANVPLIVHVHATEFDRSGEFYGNPLVHEVEQQGLLMADRIIAVSQITKDLIVRRYGIPADKIDVVHNTIDPATLGGYLYDKSTYLYLESLRAEGYSVVTTVGRLTVQKGMKYFLHAAARACQVYDKLVFLIVGHGELRDELILLSTNLGISDKVFFTGFIRGQPWRDAYALSDIFVMSSVSEPFGLVALEAAAHDSAVLISRQSGVGEVLQHVMRFDYWDIDRLADQLVGIATLPPLAEQLRHSVKQEYDGISWNDVARQITATYQQAGAKR